MSKYTTEVRFICEQFAGKEESVGLGNTEQVIQSALPKIFDFDFPIYDESYRNVLETKIIKHYYTREIGLETVGSWKFWLNKRLNEIMPYYNQLYKSTLLEFNPFYDFDYTRTGNKKGTHDETSTSHNTRTDNLDESVTGNDTRLRTDNLSESTSNTRTDNLKETTDGRTTITDTNTRTDNLQNKSTRTDTNKHTDAYSDTPQGALTNVENNTYLTNARLINETNKSEGTSNDTGTQKNEGESTTDSSFMKDNTGTQTNQGSRSNTGTQDVDETHSVDKKNTGTQKNDGDGTRNYSNTDDYLEHVAGKRNGTSYSEMLTEYRKTFLNIDMMVIDELGDLFMNLW